MVDFNHHKRNGVENLIPINMSHRNGLLDKNQTKNHPLVMPTPTHHPGMGLYAQSPVTG